ncbi:MAG: hypothetical protein WBV33_02510, partial [Terracidiphilus sp.]
LGHPNSKAGLQNHLDTVLGIILIILGTIADYPVNGTARLSECEPRFHRNPVLTIWFLRRSAFDQSLLALHVFFRANGALATIRPGTTGE